MKGKSLAIILAAAAVLGGAGIYLYKNSGDSWKETGNATPGAKVMNLDVNAVAQITIKTHSAELNLIKKDDEWTVQERGGYPANFENVSNLLRKIWDTKTVQEVKVGASQLARLELEAPEKDTGSGTRIDFKGANGQSLGGLLIGKRHLRKSDDEMSAMGLGGAGGFPVGRYVLPTASGAKVSLITEQLEEAVPSPEQWLNHDFIKPANITSITLAGSTEPRHWKVTRNDPSGQDWKLDGAKPEETLDTGKVSPLATTLSGPGFFDVLAADAKPADTGLDKPEVLTVETSDKITYTLKIGKLTGENYPVAVEVSGNLSKERAPGKDEKPEEKTKLDEQFKAAQKTLEEKLASEKKFQGRPYLISKFTIEQLLKDRSALLQSKQPEAPAAPPKPPGAAFHPGAPLRTGPVSATTPPVSVATPPVSAPPAPNAVPPKPPGPKPSEPKPVPAPKPAPPTGNKPAENKPVASEPKPAPAPEKPAAPEAPKPGAVKPAAPAPGPSEPKPSAPPEKLESAK
jgi:hypothetical protein